MGRSKRKEKQASEAAAVEDVVGNAEAQTAGEGDAPAQDAAPAEPISWSNLWQVPAILISLLLIGIGIYSAMETAAPPSIADELDQVQALLDDEQYETAASHLEINVKPLLHDAERVDRARFHAIVGDWIGLTQEAHNASIENNNRLIDDQYQQAAQLGHPLNVSQIERWALANVSLDDIEKARFRLDELEALLSLESTPEDARERRNNLYRKIVEYEIRHSKATVAEVLATLDDFRRDQLLDVGDEAWAVARQAELRINNAMAQQAIDYLLIEMRRLEQRITAADHSDFGELYMLLGKAYSQIGNNAYARYNLNRALDHFAGPERARGWTLVLLGNIAAAQGEYEEALLKFETAVRDFEEADCYTQAVLGRAELYSILGQHEEALSDYQLLADRINKRRTNVLITREDLVNSLVQRHDAALTMQQLEIARPYINLAAQMFAGADLPAHVLFRMASTTRQIADDKLAAGSIDPDTGEKLPLSRIDPAVRADANDLYKESADAYVQHARVLRSNPDEQDAWADSLWMAADGFDHAGMHDQAAELFAEYVGARSEIDPRRPEAVFRLAQSSEARMDYETAAMRYQQLIDEHPRSAQATASFVPLSRCLMTLDRKPEAVQLLTRVVNGLHVLEPDAIDYRDALIQLGILHYEVGRFAESIKYLSDAEQRYPDDPRVQEIRFRLADAHRRFAMDLDQKATGDATLSPDARRQLQQQRDDELNRALALFSQALDGYSNIEEKRLDALQLDFQRRAFLYRADCAFMLQDYARAISLYDEASRRYADQNCSLVALVQIVNCYYSMNEPAKARTAEQRARVRLKQLPDEAFDAADALMDRLAWERWLQHSPPGQSLIAAAETQ